MDDLTRYIYPLEEKLILSNRIKLSFDNPRKDYEIENIEKVIKRSFHELPTLRIPEEFLTLQLQNFLRENSRSPFINRLCTECSSLNGMQILARIWILQRWEYTPFDLEKISYLYSFLLNEHKTYLTEISTHLFDAFFREEHAVQIVYSIYYFLSQNTDINSLMNIVKQNIRNRTLNENHTTRPDFDFWDKFYLEALLPNMKSIAELYYFPNIKDKFIQISQWIDAQSSIELDEKLIFLSDYLHLVTSAKDDRIELVLQVSIIEALLTHNPFRSNEDDSVSKQFQTKVAEIVLKNSPDKDPNELRLRLREIYSIRSKIAHGDLRTIHYSRANNNEDSLITSLKKELEEYLRLIVLEYIKNPIVINNLKRR